MSDTSPTRTDWSDQEIDLIIADYFDMLAKEVGGISFVKAHRNAELQKMTGRSRGSIEFKHQNISAVLARLGLPWIIGYKPLHNYQKALLDGIERFLDIKPEPISIDTNIASVGFLEPPTLFYDAPPSFELTAKDESGPLERLVRKFDPAKRDERNRALGLKGEAFVFQAEQNQLRTEGRDDLARKVKWVSQEDGDGAGFDILSFDSKGKERLLEIKTTLGHQRTPFYISENERSLSAERPDDFRLVRLYDFSRTPRAFRLKPPLEDIVSLNPVNYRATFS